MTRSLGTRLPILLYHWFSDESAAASRSPELGVLPADFAAQIDWLREAGWRAVSLDDLASSLDIGTRLPKKSFVITFDDAYEDFLDHGVEVVSAARVPVTLFVVADRMGADNLWDREAGEPRRSLLDSRQLRELVGQGVSIGSHSRTHRDLTSLEPGELTAECRDSRRLLEDGLGVAVRHFAYPHGRHNRRVRDCVEESGYETAAAVLLRPSDLVRSSRFALMRVTIHGNKGPSNFRRRLRMAAPWHRSS